MSSIEDKVVKMQFDNAAFERGIQQTLNSLNALNKSLALTGATKGLTDLNAAAKGIGLEHIQSGIQGIAEKFKAMSVVGITALTNIANRAVNAGLTLVKSLTIDPVKTGLTEYETNLNSIQTILANTGLEGAKGLAKVTAALDELNHYSDQTIYNFSEMARNIGTFTAAGVTLEVATEAIKGIANLAAVSGSNAQQASTAMYQLSQAISAGKVTLEDWNSVVNAGMGGKVFQDSLMETARIHGVAIDKMVKDAGSFRLTLQEGWLTGEILTETLSKFTGDLTAAQLKTMGYNEQQIAGILKMGKVAQDAATKIKTASQLINTLQESAVSGWSQTWALVFGDFEEAKTLFTGINNVLGGFINSSSDARNKVLEDWKALGGRTSLIYSIGNAFQFVMDILRPIRDAFRQIFPATTGQQLFELTQNIRAFTERLKVSSETADKIKRTFAGLFAVLSIGFDILKAVVGLFFDLSMDAADGAGGLLSITAAIGDFLVAVRNAIREGGVIQKVFSGIGKVLKIPIQLLKQLGSFLGKLFDNFDALKAVDKIAGFVAKLSPVGSLGDAILRTWARLPSILGEALNKFFPFAQKAIDFFTQIGEGAGSLTDKLDFTKIFGAAGAGAFISILLTIRSVISRFGNSASIFENISDGFEQLNDTLGAMQNTLRAATLIQIAVAIGILTLSLVALSKIDAEGLAQGLSAIAVMFAQLFGAMAIFEKFMDLDDIGELILLGIAMTVLAVAIDVLSVAVIALSKLSWEELAKGLLGVGALLAGLVVAMKFMPNPAGLIATSSGLIVLGVAIKILVSSVKDISELNWEELAKGLVGVGALLGALILFTKFVDANKGGILQGAGIILLGIGIKILADAVKDFSELSWMEMARGLTAMAGGLVLVGAALILIPPTAPLSAAGVVLVSLALKDIGDAVKNMSDMKWGEIAKGLVVMAGALGVIVTALILLPPSAIISAGAITHIAAGLLILANVMGKLGSMKWEEIAKATTVLVASLAIIALGMASMSGAIAGSFALLVVAASLAVLAPVLLLFGKMSWEEIGKGLLMLAGALTVIGLAGLILQPVVPALIGLGLAVTLLGVGMLAAGAGLLLFATGLTALSVAGAAGTAVLVGMVAALAGLIPVVLQKLGEGIILFATTIQTAGPQFTAAVTVVLLSIISAIEILTPKIIDTLLRLLLLMLETMLKYAPKMSDTGLKLLVAVLTGMAKNMDKVVTTATDVIVAFLNALAKNQPKVVDAGVKMIIAYINGLADAIRKNSDQMSDAGWNLATAIIEGMAKGLYKGSTKITAAARSVAKDALNAAMDFLGIKSPSKEFEKIGKFSDQGFAAGLKNNSDLVEDAAAGVGAMALEALKKALDEAANQARRDVDLKPTITPVLDLSDVKRKASSIVDILAPQIPVGGSYDKAKAAEAGVSENRERRAEAEDASSGHSETTILNQYNSSPKPLSTGEVYRQTSNLLSKKGGFTP